MYEALNTIFPQLAPSNLTQQRAETNVNGVLKCNFLRLWDALSLENGPKARGLCRGRAARRTAPGHAATDVGGVFKTLNGGGTWVAVNNSITKMTMTVASTGVVYVGTDSAAGPVFRSADGGATRVLSGNWLRGRRVTPLS